MSKGDRDDSEDEDGIIVERNSPGGLILAVALFVVLVALAFYYFGLLPI